MKTIKNLKNVISIATFALVMLVSFNVNGQDIKELNNDKDFQKYVVNQVEFIKKAKLDLIKKIDSKNLKEDKEMNLFYEAYSTNKKSYNEFKSNQDLLLRNFSKKYSFNSYNEKELYNFIKSETAEVYYSKYPAVGFGFCDERYNNDLVENLAAAVVAHLGCVALDITVIAGLVCHGAVTLGHTAANQNAYLDYLECLKN